MRAVATRAGVSPAQVQYYFRTKGDLVAGAFAEAGEAFLADLQPWLQQASSLTRLQRLLERWLPLDDLRERRARLWVAFTEAAVCDAALTVEAARTDGDVCAWLATEVEQLRSAGEVRADVEPAVAARVLLALVDGLTTQALVVPVARRHDLVVPALRTGVTTLLA